MYFLHTINLNLKYIIIAKFSVVKIGMKIVKFVLKYRIYYVDKIYSVDKN